VDVGKGDGVGVAVVCGVDFRILVPRQAVNPRATNSVPVIFRYFLRVSLVLSAMSIL
jgi:hypothetical protein